MAHAWTWINRFFSLSSTICARLVRAPGCSVAISTWCTTQRTRIMASLTGILKDRRRRPEGVNESQSKFLEGTRPISQNRPDAPLFQLGQDRTAIAKLSAFGTGLGTTEETQNSASKTTSKINDKNQREEQFISSQAFHRTLGERVRETTAGQQFKPRAF
jgi:hypothetical protein